MLINRTPSFCRDNPFEPLIAASTPFRVSILGKGKLQVYTEQVDGNISGQDGASYTRMGIQCHTDDYTKEQSRSHFHGEEHHIFRRQIR